MIEYEEANEFKGDFKKLVKRFVSLPSDFWTVKRNVIELRHSLNINNFGTFEIPGFSSEEFSFWKIKKFACRSLKGRGVKSGLRIIYRLDKHSDKVFFIEIYFKGDKATEDRTRIVKYWNKTL